MKAGFSLMELLAVMVILAILAIGVIPAISGIQSSYQLSRAAAETRGGMQLARQLAITHNSSVYLDLCQTKDELGKSVFNTLILRELRAGSNWETVSRPIRLPAGFSISTNMDWSSVMTLPSTNVPLLNATVPAKRIRFISTGAADLNTSSNWCLTVFQDRKSSVPGKNFVTFVLFPATGRLMTHQP
jgi:prepilin-type N-terminal cleavage/methylation domain-containing protein